MIRTNRAIRALGRIFWLHRIMQLRLLGNGPAVHFLFPTFIHELPEHTIVELWLDWANPRSLMVSAVTITIRQSRALIVSSLSKARCDQ